MRLITNFRNCISENDRSSRAIFRAIKPFLMNRLQSIINSNKTSKAGRPVKLSFDNFFNALFHLLDSGAKITSIPDIFQIPKTTFLRYLRLLVDNEFFAHIHEELIKGVKAPKMLIIDSFLVKSTDGREGTGRNPCDRGRRGVKVFLACSEKLIAHKVIIEPANKSENTCLRSAIQVPSRKRVRLLADAGYVGRDIALEAKESGYRLIAKPRRTRNGQMTHKLSYRDAQELAQKRPYVEHLNARIRRFRGVDVKRVKSISVYRSLIYFALLLIAIFQIVF